MPQPSKPPVELTICVIAACVSFAGSLGLLLIAEGRYGMEMELSFLLLVAAAATALLSVYYHLKGRRRHAIPRGFAVFPMAPREPGVQEAAPLAPEPLDEGYDRLR